MATLVSVLPMCTGLNRTFYGIETAAALAALSTITVLIVPFMELKRPRYARICEDTSVLIVPFMELKL